MFSLMGEEISEGPYLLKSTIRRYKEAYIHILRPAYRRSRCGYEHILDLEPVFEGSSLGVSRLQADNLDFPTEPQPDLGKDDGDLGLLPGPQERRFRTSPGAPAFDGLSHSFSDECNEPPLWSQTRFKLSRPSSPATFSPFLSRSSGNVWPASHLPHTPNVKDPLRHNNKNRRKSCEYCRFRKKRCSGHSTCFRCFRQGIGCVYMPDLIAKRMTDCLIENLHPSLGSRFSYPTVPISAAGSRVGQLPHIDPGYSFLTSSINPPETPLRRSGRGTKGAPEGTTNRQRRVQPGKVPTRSVAPNTDRYTPLALGDRPDSAVVSIGPAYVELAAHSSNALFGVAAGDVDFWNACLGFDVLDHSGVQSQEVFENSPTKQPPGYIEDDVRMHRLENCPKDIDFTREGATCILGFDIFSSTGGRSSLESFEGPSAPSTPSPPLVPLSSGSTTSTDIASASAEAWAVEDWIVWYDFTSFL
jgi:hypothetical protein